MVFWLIQFSGVDFCNIKKKDAQFPFSAEHFPGISRTKETWMHPAYTLQLKGMN